ncbi:hypothetical protein [Burkholderia ubonensis]|uniref:hypothetical protein n=1 Tax=Burkholderia ubonensis TaxID=101571 RepID=UPI00076BFA4F|nr:hypothetical protein [Burkholderia ubonensis]KWO16034.1 hypothetical protein WM25_14030 [Burkholderia ubonensis]
MATRNFTPASVDRLTTARPEQSQSPLTIGDTVRTTHAGRVGTVTHVYRDGSASIRWHDRQADAPDLGHERVPRSMLIVIDGRELCAHVQSVATAVVEREMVIELHEGYGFSYQGTRAQLEAEGIIPDGLEWPAGRNHVGWRRGERHFSLRRCKVPGTKQRVAEWGCGDWWSIHVGRDHTLDPEIAEQAKKLRAMIYERSPQGKAARAEFWRRIDAANRDEKFQAFKALIPGLAPVPRKHPDRRPKVASASTDTP